MKLRASAVASREETVKQAERSCGTTTSAFQRANPVDMME
jgi:hypothetical protein